MTFSSFDTPATIERLQTYSGDQSSYASTGVTVEGFFVPISPSMDAIAAGVISQTYQFSTEEDADIQDNDHLTIDGIVYGVKGTSIFTLRSVRFLKVILEKVVN